MAKEKILIAVKTYPAFSKKHIELVCTAGFRSSNGSWIRIYPSPFRFLQDDQRYKKYQWVEMDIEKNPKDDRPESYSPNIDNIKILGKPIPTTNAWEERRKLILENNTIYKNLGKIIKGARENKFSLAIFKPTKILDFISEHTSGNCDQNKEQYAKAALQQGSFFKDPSPDFKLMPELPYKFSYSFEDDAHKKSKLMIADWETGQLYWKCLKKHKDEEIAVRKVKEKYLDDFAKKKDLYFFLGTTFEWHRRAQNPYIIIGIFYPPRIKQKSLFS